MARRPRRSIFTHLTAVATAAAAAAIVLASAGAAELGDARVASHIGQQLVADVELTMIDDPSAPVQVRLASPEVYRGAGIAVPPALSSLTLSVMRRDGRQFLHATTLRPVDADHLHLYVELVDKGQRAVRLVTLWLTPDPNPAPPPAPAPVPAPVVLPPTAARPMAPAPAPAPVPAAVPKRDVKPAVKPETKPEAPAAAKPPRPVPAFKLPAASHAEARPAACSAQADEAKACAALGAKNDALRAQLGKLEEKVRTLQARLGVAAAPAVAGKTAAAPAHDAAEDKEEAHPAPKAEKPAHGDKPVPEAAQPAAKQEEQHEDKQAQKQEEEHEQEHEQQHEQKQDAEPPAAPQEESKPAVPKPISAIKPLVPRKPKAKEAPPDESGLPWGWIGGAAAVLALAGGAGVALLRRRNRGRDADLPAEPGALDKLKARFTARAKPAQAPAEPAAQPEREAEPTLE